MTQLPFFTRTRSNTNSELLAGQALLIVLLLMTIATTVVLSGISRSVTDIKITTAEEDSLRAFSAAEAGVEEVLVNNVNLSSDSTFDPVGTTSYTAVVSPAPRQASIKYPAELMSGEIATFWLAEKDVNNNFTCISTNCFRGSSVDVLWGNSSVINGQTPAIEVSVFYDTPSRLAVGTPNDFSQIKVARAAYDPNVSRASTNNFETTGVTIGTYPVQDKSYSFKTTLSFNSLGIPPECYNLGTTGCLLVLRVRLLYNTSLAQGVALTASSDFPAQGIQIESTGQSGDATRKVRVIRGYSEAPSFVDAAIVSIGGLNKTN